MSGTSEVTLVLVVSLMLTCVSSDSVQHHPPDQPFPEDRQSPPEPYDRPIDLHDQLQSLTYIRPEQSADDDPPHNSWSALVPGTPGTDYPSLNKIPETSFSCADKIPGGYYADDETGCQVFHICNIGGSKSSFLCPEGSIFNQRHFVCDWWYSFQCDEAVSLYPENNPETNEADDPESMDSPDSKSTDNYEPIGFRNDSPKDLALASSGEGGSSYTQEILPKDNQREPLNYEQRNLEHHNEKLDRKLRGNYRNEDKFRQYPLTNSENARVGGENSRDLDGGRGAGGGERELSAEGRGEDFRDTAPRGFSFNRGTGRNAHQSGSQIPRALGSYSDFREGEERNSREGEVRFVPAL
ncbi:uncharacterized protein LOC107045024 [Diachasma alloeum]|uniref:uncharacterized protein LOC107045024 n=1 Tax=Diachasma alloeum TaxID=454923 RepID=UPI00073850A0|nr:uncharacterized protein LOC107045024 [Diachasma alloeum]